MQSLTTLVFLAAGVATAVNAAPPPANLQQVLKQKLAEQAISSLLNNQLPLKLDANSLYSTVATPPGGPFEPLPLQLSAEGMNERNDCVSNDVRSIRFHFFVPGIEQTSEIISAFDPRSCFDDLSPPTCHLGTPRAPLSQPASEPPNSSLRFHAPSTALLASLHRLSPAVRSV
ncbi:MAG: hypothetical protein ABIZ04_07390 [Opitutus sp.]